VLGLVVALAALSLPGLLQRSIWHDEAITLLETADGPTPWPDDPTTVERLQAAFEGRPSLAGIAWALRATDVHPPLYYWALSGWKAALGDSLEIARLFSLVAMAGAVVVFLRLVHSGGLTLALLAGTLLVLSTHTVHYSHEARNYAMALLAVLGATAASWKIVRDETGAPERFDYVVASVAAALAASAFLTNYFAVFPVAVILAWFVLLTWRRSVLLACFLPMATSVLVSALYLPLRLYEQLGTRGHQDAGFHGILAEVRGLALGLLSALCGIQTPVSRWLPFLILLTLIGITLRALARREGRLDRRLIALLVALLVVPPLGIFAMDVALDKHLYRSPRYFLFGLPSLAVLATLGVTIARGWLRAVGVLLLGALMAMQLSSLNRGQARCSGYRLYGGYYREVAEILGSSEGKPLALVGVGMGRGDPWSYVYELPGEVPVVFVHYETDPTNVARSAADYEDIWLLRAFDGRTEETELAAWAAVLGSGSFQEVPEEVHPRAHHATRLPAAGE
jgi:hypothetical protein